MHQEQENDQLLDGGELGPARKLYYRELIARFAHHPVIVWNLGEENTNTDEQRKAFAKYVRETDPYDHPTVIHTFPKPGGPGLYEPARLPLSGRAIVPIWQGLAHAQGNRQVPPTRPAGGATLVCLPGRDRPGERLRAAGRRRIPNAPTSSATPSGGT